MFRKNLFASFLIATFILAGSLVAFAQTQPVSGKVQLKQADGTLVPLVGAKIDVYRTDINGKAPSAKSGKNGNFAFAGLQLGAIFCFAISGPNAAPDIYPNIKAPQENLVITLNPGDGKVFTEAEVREALKGIKTKPAGGNSAPTEVKESAADKKKREEQEKQRAEIEAKNNKVKNSNEIISKSVAEGNAAFAAKNWELAIAKYTEGYEADTEYVGSVPVFLNNKSSAYRTRGGERFNAAQKITDQTAKQAALQIAYKDFLDAAETSAKAVAFMKTATVPTEGSDLKNFENNKYNGYKTLTDALRLVTRWVDNSRSPELKTTYQEFMVLETDPVKKSATQLAYADALREASDLKSAIPEYEKVLAEKPDSVDALAGIGLCLYSVAYELEEAATTKEAKAKAVETSQLGANYLQKFVDLAPDTHPLKASAKATIEELKNTQKIVPQKIPKTTPTTKKKGS